MKGIYIAAQRQREELGYCKTVKSVQNVFSGFLKLIRAFIRSVLVQLNYITFHHYSKVFNRLKSLSLNRKKERCVNVNNSHITQNAT